MQPGDSVKQIYQPAYRLIDLRYAPFLKLLSWLEEKRKENPCLVLGIDGNAAAGKTTLAQCLRELYDCEVIHMDDFFLPLELRTEARMQEVGGNVHYERFKKEVIEGIKSRKSFEYRVFSCHEMNYVSTKHISNQKMIVVEGAYSMREDFCSIYDYKIFMKIPKEQQKERILKRNGQEMYQMFEQKWIPMENRYFKELQVEDKCDFFFLL